MEIVWIRGISDLKMDYCKKGMLDHNWKYGRVLGHHLMMETRDSQLKREPYWGKAKKSLQRKGIDQGPIVDRPVPIHHLQENGHAPGRFQGRDQSRGKGPDPPLLNWKGPPTLARKCQVQVRGHVGHDQAHKDTVVDRPQGDVCILKGKRIHHPQGDRIIGRGHALAQQEGLQGHVHAAGGAQWPGPGDHGLIPGGGLEVGQGIGSGVGPLDTHIPGEGLAVDPGDAGKVGLTVNQEVAKEVGLVVGRQDGEDLGLMVDQEEAEEIDLVADREDAEVLDLVADRKDIEE